MHLSKEGWATVVSGAAAVGFSVTPGIQSWYLAAPTWALFAYAAWKWYAHRDEPAAEPFDGRFFKSQPSAYEQIPQKWLRIELGGWALGPGPDSKRGKGQFDACLSVGVRIVNKHPHNKASLHFYLQDTKSKRKLYALTGRDLLGMNFRTIPGWRDLFPPVAVDSHSEIEGHIWFIHDSHDPTTMPMDTITITNSITDEEWTHPVAKFSERDKKQVAALAKQGEGR